MQYLYCLGFTSLIVSLFALINRSLIAIYYDDSRGKVLFPATKLMSLWLYQKAVRPWKRDWSSPKWKKILTDRPYSHTQGRRVTANEQFFKSSLTGKTPFFVISPFCTHHSICFSIGFWYGSFSWKWWIFNFSVFNHGVIKRYSRFLEKGFVFQKICL